MRIALVTPRFRPAIGGVELHVERLATGLAEQGHDVEVLTQAGGPSASERLPDGVLVRRFSTAISSRHYAFSPKLAAHLSRHGNRYDLTHAHNYHALPALVAAETVVGRFVLTPHYHGASASSFRSLLHRPYRVAGRRMMRRASRVISVAQSEAALLSRDFPRARSKVTVIPNGVDARAIDDAAPFEQERKSVIFSAGRLESYKQIDRTIEAMSEMGNQYVLRVAGDGPARAQLEGLVTRRGLDGRVQLLGRVERKDLNRWLRTADVFVSMSRIEAQGISTMEGVYAGAGVVASDIPAHRDIAAMGSSLALVDKDATPTELAAAMRRAAAASPGRDRSAIPTWAEVVANTEAAYREA